MTSAAAFLSEGSVSRSIVWWVVFFGLIGWVLVRSRRRRASRSTSAQPASDAGSLRMREYAAQHGWAYEPVGTPSPVSAGLDAFPGSFGDLLAAAMPQAVDQVTGSVRGIGVRAYRMSMGAVASGGASTVLPMTVVEVATPEQLPALAVTVRHPGDRSAPVAVVVGARDIESEDFDRTFGVQGASPEFVSAVISPRTAQRMLAAPYPFTSGPRCVIGQVEGAFDQSAVDACVGMLVGFVELVPSFVWDDIRGGSSPPPTDQAGSTGR